MLLGVLGIGLDNTARLLSEDWGNETCTLGRPLKPLMQNHQASKSGEIVMVPQHRGYRRPPCSVTAGGNCSARLKSPVRHGGWPKGKPSWAARLPEFPECPSSQQTPPPYPAE